jgi:hypothetical protein
VRAPILASMAASAVLGFALACQDQEPTALRWAVRRGTIETSDLTSQLDVPQAVVAGEPGQFTVYTYGGGCVRGAYTRASVSGSTAVLEPFDSVVVQLPASIAGCPDYLKMIPHSATITFPQVGLVTIRIVGWKEPDGVEIAREKTITIQ